MRLILAALMTCALAATPAAASDAWQDTLAQARGQTVYFHAWAGDPSINAYIDWVGAQVEAQFGVRLQHVKNADPAEAVAQVLAEKTAGRDDGGSVDLIWLNGENFYAMKSQALLYGPFAEDLPNFSLVDIEGKPTTLVDFGVPTDGYESPWGMAQFVFIYDTAYLAEPPRSIDALFDYAHANPGRLTYPEPPDFIGSTFLKHVLIESIDDPSVLQEPASDATFDAVTAAMWSKLEAVKPALWRRGQAYPASGPAMHQLLADGEIDFSMAFNPVEGSRAIADGILPDTVRTFILEAGTIANSHFVAIPYNAA
ncbi:MAG: ABC transporter substrate-binding protein, partial [Geminicoccaceae bacterium]